MTNLKNMFKDITTDNQEIYKITESGEYVFYFENKYGNLTFDIQCENAKVTIYGLYVCKNSDNLNIQITQKHSQPNSISDVLIKSVLYDKSKFNFRGIINIPQNSTNSQAYLDNQNLLLSDKAIVITSPQLEVIPSNVVCKHSAKTTPLDKEQLKYIISRGVSKGTANNLLLDGFISEIKNINK